MVTSKSSHPRCPQALRCCGAQAWSSPPPLLVSFRNLQKALHSIPPLMAPQCPQRPLDTSACRPSQHLALTTAQHNFQSSTVLTPAALPQAAPAQQMVSPSTQVLQSQPWQHLWNLWSSCIQVQSSSKSPSCLLSPAHLRS